MNSIEIHTPLTDASVEALHSGDAVLISGILYTARDAAHKRMVETLDRGGALPMDLNGQVLFYAGPTPAKPGRPIGSIGPTTSGRMDAYTPRLLELGLKGVIGKGIRSEEIRKAMLSKRVVYFGAIGGAAALLAQTVRKADVVAYAHLGPEAVYRLEVYHFPALVVYDLHGGNLYREAMAKYGQLV